jgi:hypothetical protein
MVMSIMHNLAGDIVATCTCDGAAPWWKIFRVVGDYVGARAHDVQLALGSEMVYFLDQVHGDVGEACVENFNASRDLDVLLAVVPASCAFCG